MAKYKKYDTIKLKLALEEIKKGTSFRRASSKHQIPHMTLRRYAKGLNKGGQPVRIISKDEENYLVNYIQYCGERCLPLTRKMLKVFVVRLVKKSGRPTPIGENGPSEKWMRKFLKRHPNLKMRKPQTIDGGRVRMANQTVMHQYFSLLKETVQKLGIEDKPHLIYNMDETGFGKGNVAQDRVCVTNGGAYTRQVSTSNHTTATVCVSADGKVLPSFVIYEKSFPGGTYRDGIPEEWLFGISPNGYMDSDLFLKWFERIFLPHASKQRPLLLLMDNHESHLSLEVVEKARENRVELMCLPPHTTHILQPLDVVLFRPLKKTVSDLAVSLGYANPNLIIGKGRFAQVLRTAVDKVFGPFNIKTAFRKCGIVPLNADAIDKSKLTPADKDFTYPKPGPGGDNLQLDPLCDTCGQFVRGHPLVTQGLIPKDLADIFVPIIGPATKEKNTRIVTESRVITGSEIYAQLREKEMTKHTAQEKRARKKQTSKRTTVHNEADHVEAIDTLPTLSCPKKRRQTKTSERKKKTGRNVQDNHELAEEIYTCPLCNIRGHTNDEDEGILWVGCDNTLCGLWYHRDCLASQNQTDVDLSLIAHSDWYCQFCCLNMDNQLQSECQDHPLATSSNFNDDDTSTVPIQQDNPECDNENCETSNEILICQVCMAHQIVSPIETELYWAICHDCTKSYHAICLPPRRYRAFELRKAAGSSWCCQMCHAL